MKKKAIVKEENHALNQAKAQLESIIEMVKALQVAEEKEGASGGDDEVEEARTRIEEDALSVEVRSDWHAPGSTPNQFGEYMILLCTGGPACRIVGDLDQYQQPETARIEYQDWGTPWTEYRIDGDEEEKVLTYCRCFYFGE